MTQAIDLNQILFAALTPIVESVARKVLAERPDPDTSILERRVLNLLSESLDHKIHNAISDNIDQAVENALVTKTRGAIALAVEQYFEQRFEDRVRELITELAGHHLDNYFEVWFRDQVDERIDNGLNHEICRAIEKNMGSEEFDEAVVRVLEDTSFTLVKG